MAESVNVSDSEVILESSQPSKETVDAINAIKNAVSVSGENKMEAAKKIPNAPVALNGIFRHPPNFTEQEWEIIIMGLKANLPLYAIARKVNCERHFLSQKIAEMKEVAQVAIDARESMVDDAEYKLLENAQAGSLAAQIYILDHLGQNRGWGDQSNMKEEQEEVHISFGSISNSDIEEGKRLIAEAQTRVEPTLAGELAELEKEGGLPDKISAHDLAVAEDMLTKFNEEETKRREASVIDVQSINPLDASQQHSTQPTQAPSNGQLMSDERYNFLSNQFSDDGGGSPFGGW